MSEREPATGLKEIAPGMLLEELRSVSSGQFVDLTSQIRVS